MILQNTSLDADVLAAVVGHIARHANVCAKVIDTEGLIVAINRHGLELLDKQAQDVCGEAWSLMWDGDAAEEAAGAVASAMDGRPASFTAHAASGGMLRGWQVYVYPLEWQDGAVAKVLVVSAPETAAPENSAEPALPSQSFAAQLNDVLHTLTNISTIATSGANILRRGVGEDRAAALAEALDDAGTRAAEAIQKLSDLLRPLDGGAHPGALPQPPFGADLTSH
ncbi:PAS domain-containing protein [Rhodobacter sp. NTK016B]|uniref:PAS domain-containing protein n=1 Tax=Rhodobacter sp. NTK016B TaxID=2759676 RepID=UPI001A900B95|nr:PAS domain-containing protein [Rhodobacter sp. NTK016B]MBN8294008.1 PAS domain-containing protein [Rhodobacter sp. NTK016B]